MVKRRASAVLEKQRFKSWRTGAGPTTVSRPSRIGAKAISLAAKYAFPRAYQVGSMLHGAYSAYKGRGARSAGNKKGVAYGGKGQYRGKFSKARKNTKKMDPYLSKGFQSVTEVNGTVSDPDCVYIGHSSLSGVQTMEMICQVLLRKLFWKGMHWDCTNMGSILPGTDALSAAGWRLAIWRENKANGSIDRYTYDTTATDSISQIIGDRANGSNGTWATFFDVLADYAAGAVAGQDLNVLQPTRLILYGIDGNGTNFYNFRTDINLQNEIIHLRSRSEIKVQNRTKSAAGDSSTDNVASNPIVGRMYEFSSGAPRSKVDGVRLIEAISDKTGVLTARGASFLDNGLSVMKEPPNPKIFWNCTKSSKQLINPGDIKNSSIGYTRSCSLIKFLKAIRYGYSASGTGSKQINLVGKCQMLALEDMININSSENISIAYEVNRTTAVYLTSMYPKVAQGRLYQLTESNNP